MAGKRAEVCLVLWLVPRQVSQALWILGVNCSVYSLVIDFELSQVMNKGQIYLLNIYKLWGARQNDQLVVGNDLIA